MEKGFKVEVKMEESLGVYLMTSGMKRKYMIYFKMLTEQTKKETLELRLEEVQIHTQDNRNYCIHCGNKIIEKEQTFCGNCGKVLPNR